MVAGESDIDEDIPELDGGRVLFTEGADTVLFTEGTETLELIGGSLFSAESIA